MFSTALNKKRLVGIVLLAVIVGLFFALNRFPKLDAVGGDLDIVSSTTEQCFQGFCIEREAGTGLLEQWWRFSVTYLRLVAIGMGFAFLVAGLAEAFLFPAGSGTSLASGGVFKRTVKGMAVGPVMNLCSACIVPVSTAFHRKGVGIEGTIAMVQSSATMNIPALAMVFFVFTPMLGFSRLFLAIIGAVMLGPLVALAVRRSRGKEEEAPTPVVLPETPETGPWGPVLLEASQDWVKSSLGYLVRLGPLMIVAAFASGLVIQWLSPATVSTYLGNNIAGISIAATFGLLINVPLLFEIPLVALLLLFGMGTAPAATLLFTAAAGGPFTFWGLAKAMPKRAIAVFAAATWILGVVGGLAILGIGAFIWEGSGDILRVEAADRNTATATPNGLTRGLTGERISGFTDAMLVSNQSIGASLAFNPSVTPFTELQLSPANGPIAIWNLRPGVVIFDYDRDGDQDFYISSDIGNSNVLYQNDGTGAFQDVAEEAGVEAANRYSTGVVACDFNNDGYQDLYVGSRGAGADGLDFRSPPEEQGTKDALFLNNRNGTFTDITDAAFGDAVNVRSAMSIACADVDGDGWLDLYVGNLLDEDFRHLERPQHAGHYNMLYRNNADLTFTEVSEAAGVRGPQILMRYPDGSPVLYEDPETGEEFEGYDPTLIDAAGNRMGEPTGQTHAVLFFDYDDDSDPDLWVANDGDRLHVYRNDSTPGEIRFTSIAREMGIDKVGAWMGFALGDYDGDADLDVFITNLGFHFRLRPAQMTPRGICSYHDQFQWGNCLNTLLRNDGTYLIPGIGPVGYFIDVAPETQVVPSPLMPPESLDPSAIHPERAVPTGLAAYDFGFGTTFFDYDNDGDQDLYWLGSTVERGEGPGGQVFPAAGRMLEGDGKGSFRDITVRARLLDIDRVDYSILDPLDPGFKPEAQRIDPRFHENGKGLAHGDLNGDGYLDLIGTNSRGFIHKPPIRAELPGPLFIWMNGGGDNNWISLQLRGRMAIDGTGSNADGIGARVYITSKPEGVDPPLVQVQEVLGGSSYISMDSINLEFGLGQAEQVKKIQIFWPSGRQQTLTDVEVNQVLLIEEPEG